jgi:hypothetical protein
LSNSFIAFNARVYRTPSVFFLKYIKGRLKNNFGILAGCGCGCERQAASTYKQYACFAFLRSLVLAAPKHPIYF